MKVSLLLLSLLLICLAQEDITYIQDQIQYPQQPHSPTPTPPSQPLSLLSFKYEGMALLLIMFYLLNYKRGRSLNECMIQDSVQGISPYLQQQFTHIGYTSTSMQQPLISESGSEAQYYASGRANILNLSLHYNLRKRQDIISYYIYEMLFPQKDEIIIDVGVDSDLPLVFAVGSKRKCKELREKHLDVRKLLGQFEVQKLGIGYCVLGQAQEILNQVFDNYVCSRMNQHVYSVHYSDQQVHSNAKNHLRVVVDAKAPLIPIVEMVLHIVDHAVEMKINPSIRGKLMKAREVLNQSKEKEEMEKHREEMRKKKEQKLRDQEAWLRSLPPEKQKKEDQKRKRKEANKAFKGKVMKVG